MKILFLGYWSANEGLSVSTIYPHLQVLSEFSFVEQIFYCSIEREQSLPLFSIHIPKVTHIPLHSPPSALVVLDKVRDFSQFPRQLIRLIRAEGIDIMICRAAPTGILGHLVHRKTGIPYWVESFEPHAAYMLESAVWKKWDVRYLVERLGEKLQLQSAAAILPVAEGYRQLLIRQGVAEKRLLTLPCTVNLAQFGFQEQNRQEIRQSLGISDTTVCGVYVGKFGDMYYEEEAFEVFVKARAVFGDFFLMVISPQPSERIEYRLRSIGFQQGEFFVSALPHAQIPRYLHAADFAFALYRPSPAKRYLSPIKIGEYWAAGLPVFLTEGIGDETDIIRNEGGGVLFDLQTLGQALVNMQKQVLEQDKQTCIALAQKYRSRSLIGKTYQQALTLLLGSKAENVAPLNIME
jgi:hypothetical protein